MRLNRVAWRGRTSLLWSAEQEACGFPFIKPGAQVSIVYGTFAATPDGRSKQGTRPAYCHIVITSGVEEDSNNSSPIARSRHSPGFDGGGVGETSKLVLRARVRLYGCLYLLGLQTSRNVSTL